MRPPCRGFEPVACWGSISRSHPGDVSDRGTDMTCLAANALATAVQGPLCGDQPRGQGLAQIIENVAALSRLDFTKQELADVDRFAVEDEINLREKPSSAEQVYDPGLRTLSAPRYAHLSWWRPGGTANRPRESPGGDLPLR